MQCFVDRPSEEFSWYETARGCIYTCSFCGHNTLPRFATFDNDLIKTELINMKNAGIKHVFINDPILGGKASRGKEILRLFNAHAPEIKIQSYMRPEFLDREFVDIIASGNHQEVLIGIQTVNPNVPDHVRNNNLSKIKEYLPMLSDKGVPWRAELITGLPGDTIDGLRNSLRFVINELRPTFLYSYHLTAIPDTVINTLVDNYSAEHWLQADPKTRRITASSTADEESMSVMLMYSTAVCALYMKAKAAFDRGDRSMGVKFSDIDQTVSHILSLKDPEDLQVLLRQDYAGASAIWPKHGLNFSR